jgi:hypothetical protein
VTRARGGGASSGIGNERVEVLTEHGRNGSVVSRFRLGRGDRRALAVLLAIPVVVIVVPALFGHAIVNADNQIQNFPLRALAGQDLRHGHLPLWDPYIWSGSPLLGGLNAGALYPFSWLFAVLPALAAWTINLVVVYITAAVGMYVFLRQQRLRPFAAGFAAASFAFAGSMSAQMVHIGIVQGASWIPWMLVVEQRLARQLLGDANDTGSDRPSSVWRRVTLLGLLGGMVLLTGEPRGMADAAVVVGWAALWHIVTGHASWRPRVRFFTSFVLATAVAAAVGAVQLVPGWSFIAHSQRAQSTVTFFGSGSLPVRWSILMLVPDLMGGTGFLKQPSFFGHYNLPEITGYVGLLPLMAAAGLLARSFGRRRHPEAGRWTAWFALVVVGLVLTFGTFTPLGTFLAHVPFYGNLRLQSRNMVIAGLGLCVLLGYWIDLVLDTPVEALRRRLIRVATVVPAVAVAVTCVVALIWPGPLETWIGVKANRAHIGAGLAPSFAAALVVALLAIAVGLGYGRLRPKGRAWTLGTLIMVDLLLFTVTSVNAIDLSFPTPQLPTKASVVPVAIGTKFAVYNPGNQFLPAFSELGQNDLNTLVSIPSVEGYGSLTDSEYQNATGTRTHNTLNPCALAAGTFVPLGLSTVITLPTDLIRRISQPGPAATVSDLACPGATSPPGTGRVWWFGRRLIVSRVAVALPAATPVPADVHVGVVLHSGGTESVPATVTSSTGGLTVTLEVPVAGAGLVLSGPGVDKATDATTVTTKADEHFAMDGVMQAPLRDASFRLTGYRSGIAVFRTSVTDGPVSLVTGTTRPGETKTGSSALGTARRLDITSWGAETDRVIARQPATLVRSQAFSTGWRATVQDMTTKRTTDSPVVRVGLVQGIRLPAGTYTVTWTYLPTSVTAGLLGTLAGALVVAAAGLSWLWRRRRPRRASEVSSTATPRAVPASSAVATLG